MGYCPTLKEIQNREIKKIASRLKADSDKETITNVLAWQDSMISYWYERWVLLLPLVIPLLLAFLFFYFALLFRSLLCLMFSFCFVGGAFAVFLIAVGLVKNRKVPTWSGLGNSFAGSISMDFLLESKLAICRDYAKLTACLLSNIYPDREIYFAKAFQHVATGVMVDGRLYVLDKWLPVVTRDKWQEKWKSKRLERMKGDCIEPASVDIKYTGPPNIEKLVDEMAKLLNIKELKSDSNRSSLEVLHWKKGSPLYEDNEIVNYSLSQSIKNKIHNQRIDLDRITKLEAIQDNDDLIFRIEFIIRKQ